MYIKLHSSTCLNEIGKRDNNEDSIYPKAGYATTDSRLFIVCDGVGGSAKGEHASRLACKNFVAYCQQNPTRLPDAAYIHAALQSTEAAFDTHLAANPDSKGMGTTLTLACLHEGGITAAHIGDSRIYHVRDGKIKWCTSDHSLVNDYLKAGILTPEEAINHPQKNVITRALQGASVRQTRADIHIITDIKADDYLFMCTDGILESITDDDLCRILGDSRFALADQIAQIRNHCNTNSRDNFSCYLIKIASVEGSILPQYNVNNTAKSNQNTPTDEHIAIVLNDEPLPIQPNANKPPALQNTTEMLTQKTSNARFRQLAFGIIIASLFAFAAMNYFKKPASKPVQTNPHTKTEQPAPKPETHDYTVTPTPVKPLINADKQDVMPSKTRQNAQEVVVIAPQNPLTTPPSTILPPKQPVTAAAQPLLKDKVGALAKQVIEQAKPNPQQPK